MKHCHKCNKTKNVSEFHKSARRKDGLATQCKSCASENGKAWYKNNREKRSELNSKWYLDNRDRAINNGLKRRYGISLSQYQKLLELQEYVCAICGDPERAKNKSTGRVLALSVDHCHETGEVRGLLCKSCNFTLGYFGDSLSGIRKIVNYLEGGGAI